MRRTKMKRFLIVVVALAMVMGIEIASRISSKQLATGYNRIQCGCLE